MQGIWGEVCTLEYGKAFRDTVKRRDENNPFQVFGTNGPIGWGPEALTDRAGIVIGRKGAYRGVHFSKAPFFVIDTAFYLKPRLDLLDIRWAYYKLLTVNINAIDVGAAIPTTNRGMFYSLPLRLPPLETQIRVGAFLARYDDLIESNIRRIQLLEEAAQLIYKEWFVHLRFPGAEHCKVVDGVPDGWLRVTAAAAIEVDPRIKAEKDAEKPFVGMADLSERSMSFEPSERRTGFGGSKFQNGDTLLARITPCLENGKTGFVQCLTDDNPVGIGSTEFIVLRSRMLNPYFVYCLARSYSFREHAIRSMSGADGRQRVNQKCFDDYQVLVPPQPLLDEFGIAVTPMFEQCRTLALQNMRLHEARDLLLPRLMSGEIEV